MGGSGGIAVKLLTCAMELDRSKYWYKLYSIPSVGKR